MNWRKHDVDPYAAISIGREVGQAPTSGHIDNGLLATDERLEVSRRTWPEARASDFQKRNRREFVDASGAVFRRVSGCPWMAAVQQEVDVWYTTGGELVYLIRADRPEYGAKSVTTSSGTRGARL